NKKGPSSSLGPSGWYPPPGTSPNLLQRWAVYRSRGSRILANNTRLVAEEVALSALTRRDGIRSDGVRSSATADCEVIAALVAAGQYIIDQACTGRSRTCCSGASGCRST